MKFLPALFIFGLFLGNCRPGFAIASPIPPRTPTIVRPDPMPSPTDIQLPFNPEASDDDYCKPPYAVLEVGADSTIAEEEIVSELVHTWLKRYANPDAPPFCRIDGFTIDKVYDDPGMYSNSLEPKGDFMRIILFSVKLIQIPTDWMSFAGELDQDNWLHISHIVAISRGSEGYKLEFAYP